MIVTLYLELFTLRLVSIFVTSEHDKDLGNLSQIIFLFRLSFVNPDCAAHYATNVIVSERMFTSYCILDS